LELIVVDNSSSDSTDSVVGEWARALPFPVDFHVKENRGPAASRNLGAAVARGDVLAFTDSDCLPNPAWLRNGVRAIRAGADIVSGPIRPVFRGRPGLFNVQLTGTENDTGLYPSANLLIRRSWFDHLGGFDERFGLHRSGVLVSGEDTDLVWRAKRAGAIVAFEPDVEVRHQPAKTSLRQWLRQPTVLQILPQLVRDVPELRESFLWRRYFVSRYHFEFILLAGGVAVAVATRKPAALLAAVPWIVSMRSVASTEARRRGIAGGAAAVALCAEHFAASVGVLAAASARNRRLVL
jgi:glycosyltransferase involved in cell wall biosynthesis